MNRDELRDKIAAEVACYKSQFPSPDEDEVAVRILSLIEGERYQHEMVSVINKEIIGKAEKWDKVKEIAEMADTKICDGCPMLNTNSHICFQANLVVNALEGKEGG